MAVGAIRIELVSRDGKQARKRENEKMFPPLEASATYIFYSSRRIVGHRIARVKYSPMTLLGWK